MAYKINEVFQITLYTSAQINRWGKIAWQILSTQASKAIY